MTLTANSLIGPSNASLIQSPLNANLPLSFHSLFAFYPLQEVSTLRMDGQIGLNGDPISIDRWVQPFRGILCQLKLCNFRFDGNECRRGMPFLEASYPFSGSPLLTFDSVFRCLFWVFPGFNGCTGLLGITRDTKQRLGDDIDSDF